VKAAAIASMAASDSAGVADWRATCFSEKRARNRTGSGVASEHRLSRRARIVDVSPPMVALVRYFGLGGWAIKGAEYVKKKGWCSWVSLVEIPLGLSVQSAALCMRHRGAAKFWRGSCLDKVLGRR
jgi:hypothetical protein